jgi:hypothetical protein
MAVDCRPHVVQQGVDVSKVKYVEAVANLTALKAGLATPRFPGKGWGGGSVKA